jgi:CRP-like cAMP-binding protein
MISSINPALLTTKTLQPKNILVAEGAIAQEIFFIQTGCIRAWYNADGEGVTLQFFFEGESVTSLESFLNGTPSTINIETLFICTMYSKARGRL